MNRVYVPNLELGDKVFINFSKYGTIKIVPVTVVERLKSDAIKVETETGDSYTILRNNRMRGYRDNWNVPYLITASEAVELERRQEEQQLERKLNNALGELSKMSAKLNKVSEILAALETAKQAAQTLARNFLAE